MRLRRITHTASVLLIASSALLAAPASAAAGAVSALAGLEFAPPAAATAPLLPGAAAHVTAATHLKFASSTNWAGYAATSTKYTSVTSTWREPSASCGSATTYASFWTGLDGYGSSSVEQTGTLVYCYGGVAYQYAWYEMYPAAPVYYNVAIAAGDSMNATVTSTATGNFSLILTDYTRGWRATTTATNASLARASAEVIAEAPSSSTGVLPLANFGSVTFTNSTVNNIPLASASPINITMVGPSYTKAACTGISGGGNFTCYWYHA